MSGGLVRMFTKIWTHPENEGRRLRQLAIATRFQLRGRLLHRATIIPIGDRSRLCASIDNGPSVLAAYSPRWDHAAWQVWRNCLRPGDLFVDVGANVGVYTVLAAELGAEVVAIEPSKDNAAKVRQNLALNGYSADIWELALTDKKETLRFTSELGAMNHIANSGAVEVPGERFDDLIGGRYVHGMKIDVEGAERRVLMGARRALEDGRIGLLQLEWNETAQQNFGESRDLVAYLLWDTGYSLFRPDRSGALVPSGPQEGSDMFAKPSIH